MMLSQISVHCSCPIVPIGPAWLVGSSLPIKSQNDDSVDSSVSDLVSPSPSAVAYWDEVQRGTRLLGLLKLTIFSVLYNSPRR